MTSNPKSKLIYLKPLPMPICFILLGCLAISLYHISTLTPTSNDELGHWSTAMSYAVLLSGIFMIGFSAYMYKEGLKSARFWESVK